MVLLFWAALAVICATECATRRILCNRTSRSFPCRELLIPKSCYYARIEQRTHKLRSDTSNKRDSCELKSLAPLHNPSLHIIFRSYNAKRTQTDLAVVSPQRPGWPGGDTYEMPTYGD